MHRRRTSVLVAVLALGAVPAPALALRRSAHHVRPRAFASCARLVRYERRHFAVTHGLPESSPRPFSEPSIASSPPARASPQAPSAGGNAGPTARGTAVSPPNNQEPGIEEPDILKTDGSTLFAVEQGPPDP